MTTNAKLLLSAIGAVALAATPAMAKVSHVRTNRSHTEQVVPLTVGPTGVYAYEPGSQLPRDFRRYNGYQPDRQIVGIND
jgi:hypothetical protein